MEKLILDLLAIVEMRQESARQGETEFSREMVEEYDSLLARLRDRVAQAEPALWDGTSR